MTPTTDLTAFEHEAMSVSQALEQANYHLNQMGRILVIGEISQLTARNHWYFTLKDPQSVISCIMFAGSNQDVTFTPAVGQKVLIVGAPTVYPKTGRMQLRADIMQLAGRGRIMEELKEREQMLRAEGWFNPEHKRKLPRLISHVGVVTSCDGRVIDDIIFNATRRNPLIKLTFFDTLVQGPNAPQALVTALTCAYHLATAGILPPNMPGKLKRYYIQSGQVQPNLDAIIIGRGGGSFEDLLCFSDADVVRLVGMAPVPIISAVGHDEDRPICDLSADLRASTPTAAAELITPITRSQMLTCLEQLTTRAHNVMLTQLDELQARSEHAGERLDLNLQGLVLSRVQQAQMKLELLQEQSHRQVSSRLEGYEQRLLRLEGSLKAHSPGQQAAHQAQRLQAALYRLEQVPARLTRLNTQAQYLEHQLEHSAHTLQERLARQVQSVTTQLPQRLTQAVDYQVKAWGQRAAQLSVHLMSHHTALEQRLLISATQLRFELMARLERALSAHLARTKARCADTLVTQSSELITRKLQSRAQQLQQLEQRCAYCYEHQIAPALSAHRTKLTALSSQLEGLNPLYQLSRGLSITTLDGVHSVSGAQLSVGSALVTLMLGYKVTSTVTAITPDAQLQPQHTAAPRTTAQCTAAEASSDAPAAAGND